MGRATSKGNEVKSKMKQPSGVPRRDSNTGGSYLWSNTLPLDHGRVPLASNRKLTHHQSHFQRQKNLHCAWSHPIDVVTRNPILEKVDPEGEAPTAINILNAQFHIII